MVLPDIFYLKMPWNTIENFFLFFIWKKWKWTIHRYFFFFTYCLQKECIVWVRLPRKKCSFSKCELTIYDIFFEKSCKRSQTMTHLTGSMVRIKWKIWKHETFECKTTVSTRSMKRKMGIYILIAIDRHVSISFVDRHTEWILQSYHKLIITLLYESVDNDKNWRRSVDQFIMSVGDRICFFSLLKSYKSHVCNFSPNVLNS